MLKSVLSSAAIAALVLAPSTALALTGAKGNADRIAVRAGYAQYAGKIDLRDATNTLIFYYWGGDRCAGAAVAPTDRQIDFLLNSHLAGHEVSLDYTDVVSAYGTSRCWDGGIQIY